MMKHAIGAMMVGLSAGASAQWVAVGTSNFPIDELYAFDPDNPGAADLSTPLATLTGPFTRGIALTGVTTGWYIRTSTTGSVSDPAGLYRLEGGVSTLVAQQPFANSSDTGGLDFTRDGSAMWGVIDPGGAGSNGDTLYRIGFDGTYTEIGQISISDGSGTSIRISAIATDPTTGDVIALDALRDQLYRIDTATGLGTVIGDLGVELDNLTSGMDFDDSGRLIVSNNEIGLSTLYEIDLATGAISATLGQLGVSTSSISFIPAPGAGVLAIGIGLAARRRR